MNCQQSRTFCSSCRWDGWRYRHANLFHVSGQNVCFPEAINPIKVCCTVVDKKGKCPYRLVRKIKSL